MRERLLELADDLARMQPPRFRPIRLGKPGDRVQHLDVARDQRCDVRPQHLHDDGLAVAQACGVHLSNRRGRERRRVELGEDIRDLAAERPLERLDRDRAGERRHLILELRELRRDLGLEQVRAHGQHLAELHEDRAELLEREPQSHAERLCRLAARQNLAHPRDRAQQVRAPNDLVEPVTHERALDREHPEEEAQTAAHVRHRRSRRASRAAARSTSSRNRSTSA